jgi:hypothetical protein
MPHHRWLAQEAASTLQGNQRRRPTLPLAAMTSPLHASRLFSTPGIDPGPLPVPVPGPQPGGSSPDPIPGYPGPQPEPEPDPAPGPPPPPRPVTAPALAREWFSRRI